MIAVAIRKRVVALQFEANVRPTLVVACVIPVTTRRQIAKPVMKDMLMTAPACVWRVLVMATAPCAAVTEHVSFQLVRPCASARPIGPAPPVIRVRRRLTPKQIQKVMYIVSIIVNPVKHATEAPVLLMAPANANRTLLAPTAPHVLQAFFQSEATTSARCAASIQATRRRAFLARAMSMAHACATKVHPGPNVKSTVQHRWPARFAVGTANVSTMMHYRHTRILLGSKHASVTQHIMAIRAITSHHSSMT